MKLRTLRWTALVLACLLVGACKDRYEPVKPTAACVLVSFVDF